MVNQAGFVDSQSGQKRTFVYNKIKEKNMNDKVLQYSDRLHNIFFDKYAVERRCVPSADILLKTLHLLNDEIKNKEIFCLIECDYENIFHALIQNDPQMLKYSAPDKDELDTIINVFRHVIKMNLRENSVLNTDDLWVLCLLFNLVSYENNPDDYLEKFKMWEIR